MNAGILLCVGIRGSRAGEDILEQDLEACAEAGVGGVILFDVDVPTFRRLQGEGVATGEARLQARRNIIDAEQLSQLIVHIRQILGSDIFVSIDQEGGSVARLSPARGFAPEPTAREFALLDQDARREAARAQARQLADLGFDLNFAPCVDLALEPENKIITQLDRAYGKEVDTVVACAEVVLEAHAKAGLAVCLKHFPGHGSSRGDSHLGAVDISATWQREAELAPYRALMERPGVAIMVAHVIHEELGGDLPASLSTGVVEKLLRTELEFGGVVVTDAIDMLAVADRFQPGEAAVMAVNAGVDLIIDGFNLHERNEHPAPVLVAALQRAVENGTLHRGEARIDESVNRLRRLRARLERTD